MIVIGKSTLVFDITYFFGEKSTNKYISVPEASEEELVDAAVHVLINNCGEVLICTQNEVKTEEKLRGHGYRSGVDYFFFSDLKYGFINMQKKSEKAEQDYLWNIYCKIIYSPTAVMSNGTLENIWHSARAKLLRLSMLNVTPLFPENT